MKPAHKVAIRIGSQEQLDRLKKALEDVGYTWVMESSFSQDYPYIINYFDQECHHGVYMDVQKDVHECSSEEEFIALASMREGDEFYVGEWVYSTDRSDNYREGELYRISKLNTSTLQSWEANNASKAIRFFRKANKEEITNKFKPSTKQETTMDNKQFYVTGGSRAIREAFLKELKEQGYKELMGDDEQILNDDNYYLRITTSNPLEYKITGNTQGTCYTLPQQYNEALQAFKDALPKKEKFEKGKWYVSSYGIFKHDRTEGNIHYSSEKYNIDGSLHSMPYFMDDSSYGEANIKEATEQEVAEVFAKYWEKQGFKVGTMVDWNFVGSVRTEPITAIPTKCKSTGLFDGPIDKDNLCIDMNGWIKISKVSIHKEPEVKIGGYTADFSVKGIVKFGCQHISKQTVEQLLGVAKNTSLSIGGVSVTEEMLSLILKNIK